MLLKAPSSGEAGGRAECSRTWRSPEYLVAVSWPVYERIAHGTPSMSVAPSRMKIALTKCAPLGVTIRSAPAHSLSCSQKGTCLGLGLGLG